MWINRKIRNHAKGRNQVQDNKSGQLVRMKLASSREPIKISNKAWILFATSVAWSRYRHRDLPEISRRKQKNERPRSCSNLIKKFLHGSAAHSATPSCLDLIPLPVSPLSLSLPSGARLEKLKIIFLRKRINPGGGGRGFLRHAFLAICTKNGTDLTSK